MKNTTFHQWTGGAKESEIEEMRKCVTIKRNFYFLIWLVTCGILIVTSLLSGIIPLIGVYIMYGGIAIFAIFGGAFCGLGIFAGNTLAFIRTRGRSTGSGVIRTVLLVLGGIIVPIIVVQLCSKSDSFGQKICGLK